MGISMDEFTDELLDTLADKLADQLIIVEEQPEDDDALEDDDVLDYVLGLSGGAKPMKAMAAMKAMASPMKAMAAMKAMKVMKAKSAMKSPMKSPMKAMKMNAYFTKMMAAKKEGAKSFEYNGKTYVATKAKTGMVIYKAK